MGYMHIPNLYKNKEILMVKQVYCLEKIHGSSSHVTFDGVNQLHLKNDLFDKVKLLKLFKTYFNSKVIVYGEIYGDNILRMRNTYGDKKRFVAFDVNIDGMWLSVPNAHDVCNKLGIEFVDYSLVPTDDFAFIDYEKNRPSIQAMRNGMGTNKTREGIVIRPLIELTKNNGKRIMAKYKNDEFRETKTPRIISDEDLKVLSDATQIASEWVTAERLRHVLDKLPLGHNIKDVIDAMNEDISREAKDEIIESKESKKAINKATVLLFKKLGD